MSANTLPAKYAGKCAQTGRDYPAGTQITKGAGGWQIAEGAHVADLRRVEFQPLAPEFGGTTTETRVTLRDLTKPMVCSCSKSLPDFDESAPETYSQCVFLRVGDTFRCGNCGRTGQVLSQEEVTRRYPPETRTCWECGGKFTYAECRQNGGDWNENGGYCGC